MGFVTFASFDDTLSNSHKKNIEKLFLSWDISFKKFTVHTQILTPYLLFTIKPKIIGVNSWVLWHWLHLMTLFQYLTKKYQEIIFFHEKYLIEPLFPFLWVAV